MNQHLQNTKAISISVALAKDSLKTGDYKLFQDSNIPLFYKKLRETIKKCDKIGNLNGNIKSLIKTVLEGDGSQNISLLQLKNNLKELEEKIKKRREKLTKSTSQEVIEKSRKDARRIFKEYIEEEEKRINAGNKGSRYPLATKLNESLTKNIEEAVNKHLEELIHETAKVNLDLNLNQESYQLERKKEKIKVKRTSYYKRERDEWWAKTIKYITVGAITLYEKGSRTYEEEQEIDAGTNKAEIYDKFNKYIDSELPMTINKELEHVAQNYLDPLEKSIQEMKK